MITMMFQDFYAQYHDCLICKEQLQTFASFVFFVKRKGQIEPAGDILYAFDPEYSRFFKEEYSLTVDGHEDMAFYLDEAFDNIVDSFNPMIKTFPRIGQSKLSKRLNSKWRLSGLGLTYSKCCANDEHYFAYEAETVSANEPQSYSLFTENLETCNININNLYCNNAQHKTIIHSQKHSFDFSMLSLPINEWDISSEATFINQVHRYAILQ